MVNASWSIVHGALSMVHGQSFNKLFSRLVFAMALTVVMAMALAKRRPKINQNRSTLILAHAHAQAHQHSDPIAVCEHDCKCMFVYMTIFLLVNFRKVKLHIFAFIALKCWADAWHLRLNSADPGRVSCATSSKSVGA